MGRSALSARLQYNLGAATQNREVPTANCSLPFEEGGAPLDYLPATIRGPVKWVHLCQGRTRLRGPTVRTRELMSDPAVSEPRFTWDGPGDWDGGWATGRVRRARASGGVYKGRTPRHGELETQPVPNSPTWGVFGLQKRCRHRRSSEVDGPALGPR